MTTYNEYLESEWEKHKRQFIDAHSKLWSADVRADIQAFVAEYLPGSQVTEIIFGNGTALVMVDDMSMHNHPEFDYSMMHDEWERIIDDAINIDQYSDPFPMDYIE